MNKMNNSSTNHNNKKNFENPTQISFSHPLIEEIKCYLKPNEKLCKMFCKCFYSSINTSAELLGNGEVYVVTGDIDAMWLRDSSAQFYHYIPYCADEPSLSKLIRGVIRRQMHYILTDPYANSFNKEPNDNKCHNDIPKAGPWVWEQKYEVDSLCYPVWLLYNYTKKTKDTSLIDARCAKVFQTILAVWKTEQRHFEQSPYRFSRNNTYEVDTIYNDGLGFPVNYTGMTWSGFRPSDDGCTFGYLIPSNMFATVVLGYIAELSKDVLKDESIAESALNLKSEIERGIRNYGIYNHYKYGRIYAYETDGFGNYKLMDDANVPSLLSIPYLGFCPSDDEIYQNTRRFILSEDNPFYSKGNFGAGIGSPHTPDGYIWHISLIMQALTSNSREEIGTLLKTIINSDADTLNMHEAFNKDNPYEFTRPWFTWPDSLFAELIIKLYQNLSMRDLLIRRIPN